MNGFKWGLMGLLALGLSTASLAQDRLISPGAGTAERKAILDGVRPAVELKLQAEVQFVVNSIQAYKGWAMVNANPQRKDGRKFDVVKLFGKNESMQMDGLTVTALLQRRGGNWVLVEHMIGATDIWWEKYCHEKPRRIPAEVLGVCPN
jgi:hypothetical protein